MKPIVYYGFGLLLLMVLNTELAGRDYTAIDFALTAFIIAVVAMRGFKNRYHNSSNTKAAIKLTRI
jgi:hypothetical protein